MAAISSSSLPVEKTPYVHLYEDTAYKNLRFSLAPKDGGTIFFRDVLKIQLKSYDINLPAGISAADDIKRVEIWAIYGDENTASLEAEMYSVFLEPEYALRANPGKYSKVVTVYPGQHVRAALSEPVKKVLILAQM